MKELAILYFLIFVVALLFITNYNSILFEFSDLFLLPNLVLAIAVTCFIACLHFIILKKKQKTKGYEMIVAYYLTAFILCFAGLCLFSPPTDGKELLELLPLTGLFILIIGMVHIAIVLSISAFKDFDKSCHCKLLMGLNENGIHNTILKISGDYLQIFSSNLSVLKTMDLKSINSISLVTDEILDEKGKSILGRAVVGGLVFGVVGAVVGGMTGIGTKKEYKLVKLIKIETDDITLLALPDDFSDPSTFVRTCRRHIYQQKEDN